MCQAAHCHPGSYIKALCPHRGLNLIPLLRSPLHTHQSLCGKVSVKAGQEDALEESEGFGSQQLPHLELTGPRLWGTKPKAHILEPHFKRPTGLGLAVLQSVREPSHSPVQIAKL